MFFDNVEDAWNSATYGGAYHLVNEDPQKFVLISNDGRNLDIIHGNIDPDVDMAGVFWRGYLSITIWLMARVFMSAPTHHSDGIIITKS